VGSSYLLVDVITSRVDDHNRTLIAQLASDPAFAASLAAATTVEDAQQIASKHGFDVTSAELTSVASDGNLTDADLEAVAGGGLFDTKKHCGTGRVADAI
jgi:predicted ribosomally synthesized peptide with nif11-like leader